MRLRYRSSVAIAIVAMTVTAGAAIVVLTPTRTSKPPVLPDRLPPLPSSVAPPKVPYISTADFSHPPGTAPRAPVTPTAMKPPPLPEPERGAALPAFDPQRSKLTARDAFSDIYQNPDGSHTAFVYSGIRNIRDRASNWEPIDTTIVRNGIRGFRTRNDVFDAKFAARADADELVSVQAGSGSLSFSMLGAKPVPAVTSGSTIRYPAVDVNTDLEYRVATTELKELIVLRDAITGPARWTFRLRVDGLTPRATPDKGIVFADDASGKDVLRIPPARMWDSTVDPESGEPVYGPAAIELSRSGGTWLVTLTADSGWLADPERKWPIYVDPTLSSLTVGTTDDAYVRSGYPTTNYNGSSQYNSTVDKYVDQFGCYSDSALSFLHYSMSSVTGKDVIKATWKANLVWSYYTNTPESFWIHPVQNAWSASSVTWNTFPGYITLKNSSNQPYVFRGSGYRGQAVSVDITPIVTTWLANGIANNGIVIDGGILQSGADSCPERYFKIAADENTDGSAPYLQIDYNSPPATPTLGTPSNGALVHDITPTLTATGTDPNGDTLKWYFQVCLDSTMTQCVAESSWLSTNSWTVPSGKLDWNRTYYWRAKSYDGRLESAYSAVRSFTPSNTPPNAPALAAATPVDGAVLTTLQPTLTIAAGAVTDPDNDPIRYWFKVTAGSNGVSGSVINSGWTTSRTWTVPPGVLQDGVEYTWQVSTADTDASGNVMMSTASAFTGHFRVDTRIGSSGPSPFDRFGPVAVNLYNGNAVVSHRSVNFNSIGGPIGLAYTYNSQAPTRSGLRGWYYNNPAPAFPLPTTGVQLQLVRTDPQLSFNWPAKGPFPPALRGTYFQVHWEGVLTVPVTGTYLFGGIHDDGLRITVGGQVVFEDTGYSGTVDYGGAVPVSLTAGQPVSFAVDYFNRWGPAQLHVHVKTTDGTTVKDQPLPASWLGTQASPLPDGWVLSAAGSGGVGVLSATVTDSSVVITDGSGAANTYRWTGSGYVPPVDADGVLSRNEDGSLTLLTGDGLTYRFDRAGVLQQITSGSDDRRPAAAVLGWTNSQNVPQLSTITDPVSGRKLTLRYSGEPSCPTPPPGFDAAPPAGKLCAAAYDWDGSMTSFFYVQKMLARIVEPGGVTTDYGYTNGLLTSVRSPLVADWVAVDPANRDTPAVRPMTVTSISYNTAPGKAPTVAKVTLAAPNPLSPTAASDRPEHSYVYTPATPGVNGSTDVLIAGIVSDTGYARRVAYNDAGQKLQDIDATGKVTTFSWDARDNLVSTLDPAGRLTTSLYDHANRRTDTYGPAPASCFDTNFGSPGYMRPLPGGCPAPNVGFAIPHEHTDYDQGLFGLAATWWASARPSGSPAAHSTVGLGDVDGTVLPNGTAGQAFSGTLTGEIELPVAGVYGLSLTPGNDTSVRVSIDDRVVVDRFMSYSEAVRVDDPAAYWRLSDAAGTTATDASGNNVNATYVGLVTRGVTGGPAYDSDRGVGLDGLAAHVKLPSDMIRNGGKLPISITGWFLVPPGKGGPILGYQTGAVGSPVTTNYIPMIYVGTDGKLHASAWPAPRLVSTGSVADGAWHHFAFVVEATSSSTTAPIPVKQMLCIDDVCFGNTGTTDFRSMTDNQLGAAVVTNWPSTPSTGGWWYFGGQLDDIAIYRKKLTPGQIHASYRAGRPMWSGSTTGFASYPQQILEDDPIAYWRLDEASGATSVTDLSGRGAAGTVGTGVTLGVDGATDRTATSASFDGSAGRITGSHPLVANDFAFEAWINFTTSTASIRIDEENTQGVDGTTGQHYAFAPDNPGVNTNAGAGLSVGSNGIAVYEHTGSYMPALLVWQPPTSQRPIRGWHHVAVVYADRTPTLYVDGIAVRTGKKSPKTNVFPPTRIGSHSYGGFAGGMDEVAFYGEALTAEQVQSHFLVGRRVLAENDGVLSAGRHRIRIDVRQPSGTAHLGLKWTLPGSSTAQSVPASAITPRYGLPTRYTTDDDDRPGQPGRVKTTSYSDPANGIDPALGLPVSTTFDPGGLALVVRSGYEPPGSGYLRQVSRTLPAGNSWTYTFYGDAETRDIPCPGGQTGVIQAGMPKVMTAPDPDGAGPQTARTVETVYDAVGRIAATRENAGPWSCTWHDARGRITRVDHPANGAEPARTVSYDYAVGGDPLTTAVIEGSRTIVSRTDVLGQTVSYFDVWGLQTNYVHDRAGRLILTSGPGGTRESRYDAAGRVLDVELDGNVVAVPTYDSTTGELVSVSYPSGAGSAGNGTSLSSLARDAAGRVVGMTWTLAGGVTVSHSVSRSQSGRIVDEMVDSIDADPNGPNFSYDSLGRLVRAVAPGRVYTYAFDGAVGCAAGALATAGQNSHRTSVTETTSSGSRTTNFCWDNADRLISTNGDLSVVPTYDGRGNVTSLARAGAPTETLTWDGAGRHVATATDGGAPVAVRYLRDAADRIVERVATVGGATTHIRYGYGGPNDAPIVVLDGNNTVTARLFALPGGAMVTLPIGPQPGDGPTTVTWSYPNILGHVVALADDTGMKQGANYSYDPNGVPLEGVPDNVAGAADYGWEGSSQRLYEHVGSLSTIEMGARPYQPQLGIFLAVDPVLGGSANDYDYGNADPINNEDLDGREYDSGGGGGGSYSPGTYWPDCTPPSSPFETTLESLGSSNDFGSGFLSGMLKQPSAAGHILKTSGNQAAKSAAASILKGSSATAKKLTWGKAIGKGSTVLGVGVGVAQGIAEGKSKRRIATEVSASTLGGVAGSAAGAAVCGAAAGMTAGAGALTCPLFMGVGSWAGSAVGGFVGGKVANLFKW